MGRAIFQKLFRCVLVLFVMHGDAVIADDVSRIKTSVQEHVCNIEIGDELVDTYKCEYSRSPSVLSYSYMYETGKKIVVLIDQPMGNACDGGALHVFSKIDNESFKRLKIIDFCGGHLPSITSGPKNFRIYIPSIAIDGTNENIPAEIWILEGDALIKKTN